MPTVELDYVKDDDRITVGMPEEEARQLVNASVQQFLNESSYTDVTFDVKQVFGPGGGASVIDFTAPTDERLAEFVLAYVDGDQEQADYLLSLNEIEAHAAEWERA